MNMPNDKADKPLQDGIYIVKPGQEWVSVEKGERMTWRAPDYDLEYLTRAYKGRLEFRGPIDGDGKPRRLTTAEMTEHVPEELRGVFASANLDRLVGDPADPHRYDGLFTGPLSFPGYDADGNRIQADPKKEDKK